MPQKEHLNGKNTRTSGLREEFDRRRILVVDDEERMVRFIRMNLNTTDFKSSKRSTENKPLINCVKRLISSCWMS